MAYIDDDGSLPFKGRMGRLVIYFTKKGKRIVRRKGGPTQKQMMNDPAYETARKNGSEFGRASAAAKLFREKIAPLQQLVPDGDFNNRLTGQFRKLIQLDQTMDLGFRSLKDSNLSIMPRTYLNDQCIEDLVTIAYENNKISISPHFKKINKYLKDKKNPGKATHFQVSSTTITLLGPVFREPPGIIRSPVISVAGKTTSPVLEYELSLPTVSYGMVHVIAIVFYRKEKEDWIMIGERTFNGGWVEGIGFHNGAIK